jgi:hypothetical protein
MRRVGLIGLVLTWGLLPGAAWAADAPAEGAPAAAPLSKDVSAVAMAGCVTASDGARPLCPTALDADAADVVEPPEAVEVGDEPPPAAEPPGLRVHVLQRLMAQQESVRPVAGPLPGEGGLAPTLRAWSRTRAGLDWLHESNGFVREARAALEFDLDRGTLEPDVADWAVNLRRANLEMTTNIGQFSAGRTVSQWGLGLVAQAGEADPMQFGMRRAGSLVDRVQYAMLPGALWHKGDPRDAFPLAVAVAADRVVSDDLMRARGRLQGVTGGDDQGQQVLGALLYRGEHLQAGTYIASRSQTDALGLTLDVVVYDLYARLATRIRGWGVSLAGEGVVARGTTTWLRTVNQNASDVAQFGGVVRLDLEHEGLQLRLETGLASADERPFDGAVRAFQFASDYRVGLVLFPSVLAATSTQAVRNLGDPRFVGQAPDGASHIQTHGAVAQAMYLNPTLRMRVRPGLHVLAGALWARQAGAVADPFQSFLAGGEPRGPRGGVGGRDLGLELDGALEWRTHLWRGELRQELELLVRGDAGVLLPGDAFDNAVGVAAPAVAVVQGQAALRWVW